MKNKLFLNLNSICKSTRVLGPGNRIVIWTQGCNKDCQGCISPETKSMQNHHIIRTDKLTALILSVPNLEGITISGGEPFLQSEALLQLLESIREKSDLSVIIYTGYLYEELIKDDVKKRITELCDVLIDGEYIETLNDDRGLRGSSNQRVIMLSDRYRLLIDLFNTNIREVELTKEMLIGIKPKKFDIFLNNMIKKMI